MTQNLPVGGFKWVEKRWTDLIADDISQLVELRG